MSYIIHKNTSSTTRLQNTYSCLLKNIKYFYVTSRYMTVVKFSSAIVTANAVNNDETVATYRSDRTGQCTLRHTGSCQLDIQRSHHDTRRHSCSRRRGISSELHSQHTAHSAAWIRKGYKVPVRIQCKVNRTTV